MPLPPPAQLRRLQITCVAVGTMAILTGLVGGALENRPLALGGLGLSAACLGTIFVLGVAAWWGDRR